MRPCESETSSALAVAPAYDSVPVPTYEPMLSATNVVARADSVTAPADWSLVADLPKAGAGFASSQPAFWGMVAAGKYMPVDVKAEKSEISCTDFESACGRRDTDC